MKKIIIIGSPGSGKSTFGRRLRAITGLPLYYLDQIWHRPDKTTASKEDFDRILQAILLKEQWILDGNYQRTLEIRLQACDTVFLMDFSLDICLSGAASRIGKKREDLPWIEDNLDEEFRQFIIDFPNTELPHIYELLEKYKKDKSIVIFKSRQEADDYLKTLL